MAVSVRHMETVAAQKQPTMILWSIKTALVGFNLCFMMTDWLSDADECFEREDEADADRGDDQQRERERWRVR